ncbi:CoA pyrophosphatase [Candidatus Puniceispirillum sp.]|uniref:CoA pyrophosphatase n=1 Tax=Candidatus Puniceispirillum sp. TaxID=2026719 RepID=UPI003F69A48C
MFFPAYGLNMLGDAAKIASVLTPPHHMNGNIKDMFVSAMATDRPAAVLVGLIKHQHSLHILMTRRAPHLATHAGQISFPGGKIETYDATPVDAALREAHEEVALQPDHVTILGSLSVLRSPAGFIVAPIVGMITADEGAVVKLAPDPAEVDDILLLPLDHMLDRQNYRRETHERDGVMRHTWVIDHPAHYIWGLSAAIIVELSDRLQTLSQTGAG